MSEVLLKRRLKIGRHGDPWHAFAPSGKAGMAAGRRIARFFLGPGGRIRVQTTVPAMKNPLVLLLGCLSLISTLAAAWLLATPAPVDPRVARLEADLQEARQTIAQLRADLARRPAAAPAPVPAAPATAGSPAAAAAATAAEVAAAAAGGGNLREMFRSPAMRAMLEQQHAAQIDLAYGRLFDRLQLSDEERAHFKKLLLERQKAQTDLSLKLMDRALSPEERSRLLAQYEQQKQAFDRTIETFLNEPTDWNSFRHWEDTLPERTQFETAGRSLFSASAEPLNARQEQQLIELMTEARKSLGSSGRQAGNAGANPAALTAEVIERQLSQMGEQARIVQERATAFLTPGQQQTLQAFLTQSQSLTRTGLEMSKMLIQDGRK